MCQRVLKAGAAGCWGEGQRLTLLHRSLGIVLLPAEGRREGWRGLSFSLSASSPLLSHLLLVLGEVAGEGGQSVAF